MKQIQNTLRSLEEAGNLRSMPPEADAARIDLSSNDYLGLAVDRDLRADFLRSLSADTFRPASSASRLLCGHQNDYALLERTIASDYGDGREALLFGSGYHANTGMLAALGGSNTLFVADKLVHASIIDGMTLSGSTFKRFRHNDYAHMRAIIERYGPGFDRVVVVAESVYSMDGDSADIAQLTASRTLHPNGLVYVDEAHAIGVSGYRGLGLAQGHDVDIVVGTFGKALASAGAFALMSPLMRQYMVNRCRSLIFSTSLPPVTAQWSLHMWNTALRADNRRTELARVSAALARILGNDSEPSHIQPLIVGNAHHAVELSRHLAQHGFTVLPIRTPTVPPGTERLRFSLSAAIAPDSLLPLQELLKN